ncbi:helix-turn-helix transcriptional regulator [Streptomyces nigra]|uniref:helix-turn-helix transcriptional regulator n=1 Tax=Streptomyces nigra TaxID=1827580 RepID=UPI0037F69F3D
MKQSEHSALGQFLRTRRAAIEPRDVGLPRKDGRRVPGLRREEVAHLAGVSTDYYTRLEQGRQRTASPSVLMGISRALRLMPDEYDHMCTLAGRSTSQPALEISQVAHPRTQQLMHLFDDIPVFTFNPFMDITGSNEATAFLLADFHSMPARERNGLRWLLLSPTARERYADTWEQTIRELVGMLRIQAARYPERPRLTEIVAELNELSPLFRSLWQANTVTRWALNETVLHHPALGQVRVYKELMTLNSAPSQTMVIVMPADRAAFREAFNAHRGTSTGTDGVEESAAG